MDIGRTQMPNRLARHRLDAGTYGTMGVGLGFAVAAAVTNPDKPIVSVQGDSAFGFTGMEIETMVRYNLPVKMIVLNNGGIGGGIGPLEKGQTVPPGILTYGAHYEGMLEALGGQGLLRRRPEGLAGDARRGDGHRWANAHQRAAESARWPQAPGVRLADDLTRPQQLGPVRSRIRTVRWRGYLLQLNPTGGELRSIFASE